MIIYSPIKELAKKKFNCETLEGAPLENDGGVGIYIIIMIVIGTANSHWEYTIFYNELMTGIGTYDMKMSNFTLFLL